MIEWILMFAWSLVPYRLQRALRELNKHVCAGSSSSAAGGHAHLNLTNFQLLSVDRALGEIGRSLLVHEDKLCFTHLGGVASILKMLVLLMVDSGTRQWTLPEKSVLLLLLLFFTNLSRHHATLLTDCLLVLFIIHFSQDLLSCSVSPANSVCWPAGHLSLSCHLQQSGSSH